MKRTIGAFVLVGLVIGLVLALVVSPFADSSPDGLETVAADKGLDSSARDHDLTGSPLADYGVAGVDDERLGTGLAGALGVLVTFAVGVGLFAALRVLRATRAPGDRPAERSLS